MNTSTEEDRSMYVPLEEGNSVTQGLKIRAQKLQALCCICLFLFEKL